MYNFKSERIFPHSTNPNLVSSNLKERHAPRVPPAETLDRTTYFFASRLKLFEKSTFLGWIFLGIIVICVKQSAQS